MTTTTTTTTTTNTTKVFLNTWGAYNNGSIGYGWMDLEEALDFMDENPDIDGGEFFIADIDNYTGLNFGGVNFDYENYDFIKTLVEFESLTSWEQETAAAAFEAGLYSTIQECIDNVDDVTFIAGDPDDILEELIDEQIACLCYGGNVPEFFTTYFDYEAAKRDLMFDYTEVSGGLVWNY